MSHFKKINILTRVEGHGSVELVRDGDRVVDARLNLSESPRLFEALLVGRRYDEIADIACRICSICSTVHKVAALQAVEQAMGIQISRQTALLRELTVHGGQIESHALHVFCLALPDYLRVGGFQELAKIAPEQLKMGLRIKKLGNLIQEIVGGRAIHPFNLNLGGLGRVPDVLQLQLLSEQLLEIRNDVAESVRYILGLNDILPQLTTASTCVVRGGSPLFGDHLTTSTGLTIPLGSAVDWLNEQVELHTHAKISHFNEKVPFTVGPLARLTLSQPATYTQCFTSASFMSSQKARIIELQQSVERSIALIEYLLDDGLGKEIPLAEVPVQGEGVSLIEAPRGVLLHSYRFDCRGVCSAANIITPTAINQGAMAVSLRELTTVLDGADYDQVRDLAEILIRCYDPCISCAVH
jgi:coenzyme F420-reducing hydrogenase alpha subunit